MEEFYDPSRKKLCFLDDNFFACAGWEKIFSSVLETGRRFQFRQGLDLRIMQKRQMELLASGKLDNGMIFAFDHIKDQELIVKKIGTFAGSNSSFLPVKLSCMYCAAMTGKEPGSRFLGKGYSGCFHTD